MSRKQPENFNLSDNQRETSSSHSPIDTTREGLSGSSNVPGGLADLGRDTRIWLPETPGETSSEQRERETFRSKLLANLPKYGFSNLSDLPESFHHHTSVTEVKKTCENKWGKPWIKNHWRDFARAYEITRARIILEQRESEPTLYADPTDNFKKRYEYRVTPINHGKAFKIEVSIKGEKDSGHYLAVTHPESGKMEIQRFFWMNDALAGDVEGTGRLGSGAMIHQFWQIGKEIAENNCINVSSLEEIELKAFHVDKEDKQLIDLIMGKKISCPFVPDDDLYTLIQAHKRFQEIFDFPKYSSNSSEITQIKVDKDISTGKYGFTIYLDEAILRDEATPDW